MITLYDRMPHFLGSNASEDDLILSQQEQNRLLRCQVWVQEKLDGLAVAIARTGRHRIRWELRPPWRNALDGAVERAIHIYMEQRRSALLALLKPGTVLYGEWLWHKLSVAYDKLPDLFFCYAIRKPDGEMYPLEQTHQRCRQFGLSCNEPLWSGKLESVEMLRGFVDTSRYGPEPMEGLVVTRVNPGKWPNEAKWVEPDYHRIHAAQMTHLRNKLGRKVRSPGSGVRSPEPLFPTEGIWDD